MERAAGFVAVPAVEAFLIDEVGGFHVGAEQFAAFHGEADLSKTYGAVFGGDGGEAGFLQFVVGAARYRTAKVYDATHFGTVAEEGERR